MYKILVGNMKGKVYLGDPEVNGRIIRFEDVDWIYLAQDRIQLRGLGNAMINLLIIQTEGNFLTC
jgi:hypothetical protein